MYEKVFSAVHRKYGRRVSWRFLSSVWVRGVRKGELKFAYVCKMLTHPWFIEEENGIKARCEQLGIDHVGVDANLDDEACMQALDNVIGQGADALMIVVTQQSLGPRWSTSVVKQAYRSSPSMTRSRTVPVNRYPT